MTVLGFTITITRLQESHVRISSYDELLERIANLLERTLASPDLEGLKILCTVPTLGNVSRPELSLEKVYPKLLDIIESPKLRVEIVGVDASLPPKIRWDSIAPEEREGPYRFNWELTQFDPNDPKHRSREYVRDGTDVGRFYNNTFGQRGRGVKDGRVFLRGMLEAIYVAYRINLSQNNRYIRYPWKKPEDSPPIHLFWTRKRAIVAVPVDRNVHDNHGPKVAMVGFETTDRNVIERLLTTYNEWKEEKVTPGTAIEVPVEMVQGKFLSVDENKRLAFICRGLTGDLTERRSVDDLAVALEEKGWSSMRFDYRGRGNSSKAPNLPTVESMLQDVACSLSCIEEKFGKPDVVIGQAIGCRLALECLKDHPEIPLVMWSPIIWFQTSAEIRYRMHELRRKGMMAFDGRVIGEEFIQSATDPTDDEIRSWIRPKRTHIIVHGVDDQVVPMRLLIDMRDLIEDAGARVELFLAPGPHPHPGADVQAQISKIVEVVGGLR